MAKVGSKGKYEYWITKEGLIRLWGWAIDGLTDTQIAENMKISQSTLYEWKLRFPELSEALKVSKDIADRNVENALFNKALSGDTTAMIFWLKNRKLKQWRDRIENSIVTPEPIKVEVDYKKLTKEELRLLVELNEKAKVE